jgi:hypothetical protein
MFPSKSKLALLGGILKVNDYCGRCHHHDLSGSIQRRGSTMDHSNSIATVFGCTHQTRSRIPLVWTAIL